MSCVWQGIYFQWKLKASQESPHGRETGDTSMQRDLFAQLF